MGAVIIEKGAPIPTAVGTVEDWGAPPNISLRRSAVPPPPALLVLLELAGGIVNRSSVTPAPQSGQTNKNTFKTKYKLNVSYK